jgi:hypothetical protein
VFEKFIGGLNENIDSEKNGYWGLVVLYNPY